MTYTIKYLDVGYWTKQGWGGNRKNCNHLFNNTEGRFTYGLYNPPITFVLTCDCCSNDMSIEYLSLNFFFNKWRHSFKVVMFSCFSYESWIVSFIRKYFLTLYVGDNTREMWFINSQEGGNPISKLIINLTMFVWYLGLNNHAKQNVRS